MKEDIFNLISDSEEIIKQKSFNELSPTEKTQFLVYLSPEEYESIRQNLLMINSVFENEEKELVLNNEIKNILLAAFQRKQKKLSVWIYESFIQLLNKRIPIYQTVLLLIVVIILLLQIKFSGSNNSLTIPFIDTVYVERTIKEQDINAKSVKTKKEKKHFKKSSVNRKESKSSFSNLYNQVDTQNVIIRQNLSILRHNINIVKNTKNGRSLGNDMDIYQILVASQ